jgi:hypothetical protein
MKKIILGITLACASLAAQAQAKPAFDNHMKFVAGVGFTYGGDELAGGTMAHNDLMAGKGLLFLGGFDFRLTETFSLQTTVGMHIDAVSTGYGNEATFKRVPVEMIAYYHLSKRWRLGAGVRYVSSPKVDFDSPGDRTFKNTVGAVLEGEFLVNDHVGIKLRLGSEKFKNKSKYSPMSSNYYYSQEDVKGEHIGVITNFYF